MSEHIRSDEGLTSAFESLYGDQFTLLTQLITPNYLVILPTNRAPQLLLLENYHLFPVTVIVLPVLCLDSQTLKCLSQIVHVST